MGEGDLDVRHLVVIILLGVIVIGALVLLPKVWRMEADVQKEEATKQWWPFGDALRTGFLRSLPVGIIAALVLWLATTAGFFEKLLTGNGEDVARTLSIWLGALFVLALVVDLCVTLFNWPKLLVPPGARNQPGALRMWWSGRKHKPRR